jgi:hypothetical protein
MSISNLQQYSWKASVAVTPSDATLYNFSGLYVEGAGTVVIEYYDDTTDTFDVPAFSFIPAVGKRVMAASTATGIHALY